MYNVENKIAEEKVMDTVEWIVFSSLSIVAIFLIQDITKILTELENDRN